MKKIVSIIAISSISSFAAVPTSVIDSSKNNLKICAKISSEDSSKEAAFTSDSNKCFNAYDVQFTSASGANVAPISLSTKTAADDFVLRITKKASCIVDNATYSLIDNKTGDVIPGTTHTISNPSNEELAEFKVANSYKDVSVKIEYTRTTVTPSTTPVEVSCPTSPSDYKVVSSVPKEVGIFAVPQQKCYQFTFTGPMSSYSYYKQATSCTATAKTVNALPIKPAYNDSTVYAVPNGYKCYKYPTTNSSHTDYSTDNFAIKPSEFKITLKKSPIKVGKVEPMAISVVNKDGDITNNYRNSSTNLIVTFDPSNVKAQYGFDIEKGILSKSLLAFSTVQDDVSMKIVDEHYADVDSDDTFQSCRSFEGVSNKINVTGHSKYWAGTGTNEAENNPTTNTVTSEVKQNTKKDLHFQKLGW